MNCKSTSCYTYSLGCTVYSSVAISLACTSTSQFATLAVFSWQIILSMSAKDSFEDTDLPEKRTPKCSGCKTPYDVHTWAHPGPYCTGKPEDSGANNYGDYGTEANEDPDVPEYVPASDGLEHVDEPDEEAVLLEKLHDLQLAEEALA